MRSYGGAELVRLPLLNLGPEVMGSEGYLINQFIVKRTNKRSDQWGGAYENRIRFALISIDGRCPISPAFRLPLFLPQGI